MRFKLFLTWLWHCVIWQSIVQVRCIDFLPNISTKIADNLAANRWRHNMDLRCKGSLKIRYTSLPAFHFHKSFLSMLTAGRSFVIDIVRQYINHTRELINSAENSSFYNRMLHYFLYPCSSYLKTSFSWDIRSETKEPTTETFTLTESWRRKSITKDFIVVKGRIHSLPERPKYGNIYREMNTRLVWFTSLY
jgi:hypothetical protein